MSSNRKQGNAEIHRLSVERKQLKDEEMILRNLLKTCKEQLTQLEVEGLEIKARIRNAAAKTPTVVTPQAIVQDEEEATSTSKTSKVDDLDLSTKCVDILMKVRIIFG